jgi:hypothetical protein
MINLAVKEIQLNRGINSLLNEMSSNSKLYGEVLRASNIEKLLVEKGYTLSNTEMKIFEKTINKITSNVEQQIKELTGKLFETVSNFVAGCNGTCW